MYLNTSPAPPLGKPCLRDLAQLTSPTGLLPSTIVPLLPLKQLRRRAQEIEVTHPQYREELPVLLAYEMSRCRFTSGLVTIVSQMQVAPDTPAQTITDERHDWQLRAVGHFSAQRRAGAAHPKLLLHH